MKKIMCPMCEEDNPEIVGGLEDAGGGNLRDDYKCGNCGYEFSSNELKEQ